MCNNPFQIWESKTNMTMFSRNLASRVIREYVLFYFTRLTDDLQKFELKLDFMTESAALQLSNVRSYISKFMTEAKVEEEFVMWAL